MSTSHVPGNEIGRMNIKTLTCFKGLTYKHMSKSIIDLDMVYKRTWRPSLGDKPSLPKGQNV